MSWSSFILTFLGLGHRCCTSNFKIKGLLVLEKFVLFDAIPPRGRSVILSTLFSVHSLAINWQLLFLNERKRKNGHKNVFMAKPSWKNVSDAEINLVLEKVFTVYGRGDLLGHVTLTIYIPYCSA